MPSPHPPNEFKELIPSSLGSFCQNFAKSFSLPRKVHGLVSYMYNNDRTLTDSFRADVCNVRCSEIEGGAVGSPGTPAVFGVPTGLSASDGWVTDEVRLVWNPVQAAGYEVYRSTTDDPVTALLIGNTNNASFSDTNAEIGVLYYYWVKAIDNDGGKTGFSRSDTGYRGSRLTDINNLGGWIGQGDFNQTYLSIWFDQVTGADQYDFYVGKNSDFNSAIQIDSMRVPYDIRREHSKLCPRLPCDQPVFVNNQDHLLYRLPLSTFWTRILGSTFPQDTKFHAFVVARETDAGSIIASSPPASVFVDAVAWPRGFDKRAFARRYAVAPGGTATVIESRLGGVNPLGIPSTRREAFVIMYGPGAGGAGGNTTFGGGGGGGGALWVGIVGGFKTGDIFSLVETPGGQTGAAAMETSGTNGSTMELRLNGTAVVSFGAAGGGVWNPAGGGAGGAGATITAVSGLAFTISALPGRAGRSASGSSGGMSGVRQGFPRLPAAFYNAPVTGFDGTNHAEGDGGSGAEAQTVAADAVGGQGGPGRAVLYIL